MITLEDINTWKELFQMNLPIVFNLEEGESELCDIYGIGDNDYSLVPKCDYLLGGYRGIDSNNNYYHLDAEYYPLLGELWVTDALENSKIILFLGDNQFINQTGDLGFIPISNLRRLSFTGDDLTGRKFYFQPLGDVTKVNGKSPATDDDGSYVPLTILNSNTVSAEVSLVRPSDLVSYKRELIPVYEPPLIKVEGSLYRGNTNYLQDQFLNYIISCPVDYQVYYNNKEVTELFIPKDTDKESIQVKVVTKSEYPYIGTEKYLEIPLTDKIFTSYSGINYYKYQKLNNDYTPALPGRYSNWTPITSDVTLASNGKTIGRSRIIIEENGVFTLENIRLDDCTLINNGTLNLKECTLNNTKIINNNRLNLQNGEITLDNEGTDTSFIHSSTNNLNIKDNNITVTDEFTTNNIMFIRMPEPNPKQLSNLNHFSYDCSFTVDQETWNITGEGVTYGRIDDDTLYTYNLEVEKDV